MKHALAILLFWSTSSLAADYPTATDRIADCENRWFLLEGNDSAVRVLGFAYVDPTAGVTLEHNGEVVLDENGKLVRKSSEFEGRARLISRVRSNLEIVCLSEAQVAQLGVPPVPEWLDIYRDKREAGPHNVAWASHYNHIGASKNALGFIQAAQASGFSSPELSREHAFALNALGLFQEAAKILESALKDYPDHIAMLGELGYSYMNTGDFKRGIEVYESAISKDKKDQSGRRSEFANNIAIAYSQLGDEDESMKWLEKAQKWKSDQ